MRRNPALVLWSVVVSLGLGSTAEAALRVKSDQEWQVVGHAEIPLDFTDPINLSHLSGPRAFMRLYKKKVITESFPTLSFQLSSSGFSKLGEHDLGPVSALSSYRGQLVVANGLSLLRPSGEVFRLYGARGKVLQMAIDRRGVLYAYTETRSLWGGRVERRVQMVDTKRFKGPWEFLHHKNHKISFPSQVGEAQQLRFGISEKWLLMANTLRGFVRTWNVVKPGAPQRVAKILVEGGDRLKGWDPVIRGDFVFVPVAGEVHCYSLLTGKLMGKIRLPELASASAWAHSDTEIYFGGKSHVYVIRAESPSSFKIVKRVRVAPRTSLGIVKIHYFRDRLYVLWKNASVASHRNRGHSLTTLKR